LTASTHLFYLFDALYLRNGCPTDESEQRKRGKGEAWANDCKLPIELGPVVVRTLKTTRLWGM